ncbi:hypothetical protein GCM10010517_01290 [Streptosporangium fragile]|uniref:Uncharacterized protein n=1 Tax=Streptosporangium fragile TaxID=46186 RepID=A0ABN3VQ46_9ACTN
MGLVARERFGLFYPPVLPNGRAVSISGGKAVGSWGHALVIYDRCTSETGLLDPPDVEAPHTVSHRYAPGIIREGTDASGTLLFWNGPRNRHSVLALTGPVSDDQPC